MQIICLLFRQRPAYAFETLNGSKEIIGLRKLIFEMIYLVFTG